MAQRLSLIVVSAALGFVLTSAFSFQQLRETYTAADYGNVNIVPSLRLIDEAQSEFDAVRVLVYQHLLSLGDIDKSVIEKKIGVHRTKLLAALQRYHAFVSDNVDRSLLQTDYALISRFDKLATDALDVSHTDVAAAFSQAQSRLNPAAQQLNDALQAHRAYKQHLGEQASDRAHDISRRGLFLILCIAASTVACVTGLGFLVMSHLLKELGGEPSYSVQVARRIAEGDLGVQITTAPGDTQSLLAAIRTMRDSLARIVERVRDGTSAYVSATEQIAVGNLELSSRTEEQAASLEQTAAAMAALAAMVNSNSMGAVEASALAASSSSIAQRGEVMMTRVATTMGSIADTSRQVAEIIGVIEGIAFQTNILALNAAVESARAGPHGRGFAVVAAEVRALAQRSAEAAKDIKKLIMGASSRISAGTEQVREARLAIEEVVSSVHNVANIVLSISEASREQDRGIVGINDSVAQLDRMTQKNAGLVEEAASAAESLRQRSRELDELVRVFRLDGVAHLA